MDHPDRALMGEAIDVGLEAGSVGALVASEDDVLGVSAGAVFERPDATAHSEILAIGEACAARDRRLLADAWLYTTHEPCPMCAAAACWARMEGIAFAVPHDEFPEAWGEQAFSVPAERTIEVARFQPELHGGVGRQRALEIPRED